MIGPGDVLERVSRAFDARPSDVPESFSTPDGSRSVAVVPFGDCPARGLTSWATVGASEFETPYSTPEGRAIRVEFVAAVDGKLVRFGEAVASCAFEVSPQTKVQPGTVYRDAVGRVYSPVSTPHLFSVSPFVWDAGVESYSDDDVYVTWLQLVPITDAEAEFAKTHGAEALEDAFMRGQPDLYSVTRESVPLPAGKE